MSVTLTIHHPSNKSVWEQIFAVKEWEESGFLKAFDKGQKLVATWHIFFIPVRVDTLKKFSEDLFLPLTVKLAMKVNGVAGKIFVGLVCFCLDLLFLSCRLLTALPWKILAPKKENGDFYKFLHDKMIPDGFLKGDYVNVTIKEQDGKSILKNIPFKYIPFTEFLEKRKS